MVKDLWCRGGATILKVGGGDKFCERSELFPNYAPLYALALKVRGSCPPQLLWERHPCFDKRLHRRRGGGDFSRGKVNVTLACREQYVSAAAIALMPLLILLFCCIHHSSDSQCLSVGRTTLKNPPQKKTHSLWVTGLPSNTWFLGHTRVYIAIGILTGSAVFARLTSVPNRQKYKRQTTLLSLCSNRPHLATAVM